MDQLRYILENHGRLTYRDMTDVKSSSSDIKHGPSLVVPYYLSLMG